MSSYLSNTTCPFCEYSLALDGSENQNEYTYCPICGYSVYDLDLNQIANQYKTQMSNKLGIGENEVDMDHINSRVWDKAQNIVLNFNGINKEYNPTDFVLSFAKGFSKSANEEDEEFTDELMYGDVAHFLQMLEKNSKRLTKKAKHWLIKILTK